MIVRSYVCGPLSPSIVKLRVKCQYVGLGVWFERNFFTEMMKPRCFLASSEPNARRSFPNNCVLTLSWPRSSAVFVAYLD